MTDAEKRDQAVAHLKKTTVGYVNKHWTIPPAGTEWKQALDILAEIGVADPIPPVMGNLLYSHTYIGPQANPNSTPYAYGWKGDWMQEGGGTATLIPDALAPGIPSIKFSMPANSKGHIEGNNYPWPTAQGQHMFIGQQFRLPLDWKNPNTDGWGCTICQTYYQSCVNHTLGLFLHADHMRMVALTGAQTWQPGITPNVNGVGIIREYNNGDGAAQGPSPRVIPVGRLALGVWHTVIWEIVCSYDSPGPTNVGLSRTWHRIETDPTGSYPDTTNVTGIPTLQWTPSPSKCNNNYFTIAKYASYGTSQKFGYYSGPAPYARSFEQANIRFGDTFDIVAAQMI